VNSSSLQLAVMQLLDERTVNVSPANRVFHMANSVERGSSGGTSRELPGVSAIAGKWEGP
jgi:hypothetical protein